MSQRRIIDSFRALAKDNNGAALIVFTLFLVPMVLIVGVGVDYARALVVKQRLVNAADAVAIAVGRDPGLNEAQIQTTANAYIAAHYGSEDFGTVTATSIAADTSNVNIQIRAQFNTSILRLVGVDTIDVVAFSEVTRRKRKLEVVMVLDNSGSMCSPSCAVKLDQLKLAANRLVDILLDAPGALEIVRIGLVPFSGAVNVGSDKLNSGFIDVAGISALQTEDIDLAGGTTLLSLYDELTNVSWGGCVRSRVGPNGFDLTDRPPDLANGETLWVPYLAPDVPGDGNGPQPGSYYNDYLNDDDDIYGSTPVEKQRNAAKYVGATANPEQLSAGRGPNFNCVPQSIQELTNVKTIINTAINGMQARGNTVIPAGLSWGWRVLSPAAPFQEGASYDDQETIKAIILLTDGSNAVEASNGHNNSFYSELRLRRFRSPWPARAVRKRMRR